MSSLKVIRPDSNPLDQVRTETKANEATRLVNLLEGKPFHYFHDAAGAAYVSFPVDDSDRAPAHRETWPVRSSAFRREAVRAYRLEYLEVPRPEAVSQALEFLAASAVLDGDEKETHLRVAQPAPDRLYLDLCDPAWRAVEVTASGWRIISAEEAAEGGAAFTRRGGMLPLPEPVRGGSIADLLAVLPPSLEAEQQRLLLAYLVNLFRAQGEHAILAIVGPQGSGKSTLAKMIRALVDPNMAPLRTHIRDERDLFIAARSGFVLGFDNLTFLPDWLSNNLSAIATGAGFATRTLYSNDDETIFEACRPCIYTSIPDVARFGDLVERTVRLVLSRPVAYAEEREVLARFEAIRPRVLGALLDVVVDGLRRYPDTRPERLPRMASWARWAAACEPALAASSGLADWAPGQVLRDYAEHRMEASVAVVEGSPLGMAIQNLMERQSDAWEGTATDLLDALLPFITEEVRHSRAWPKNPKALVNALQRLAPDLAAVGILYEPPRRRGHGGRRLLALVHAGDSKVCNLSSPSSPSSPWAEKARRDAVSEGDGRVTEGDDRVTMVTEGPRIVTTAKPTGSRAGDDGDDGDDRLRGNLSAAPADEVEF